MTLLTAALSALCLTPTAHARDAVAILRSDSLPVYDAPIDAFTMPRLPQLNA